MNVTKNELDIAIQQAIAGTEPNSRARNKALKSVKWMLGEEVNHHFVGLDSTASPILVSDPNKALIFDARDNERLKLAFYQIHLKTELVVVLL